jgi:hypothetical protein
MKKHPWMIAGSLALGTALTAGALYMPAAIAAARAALVELSAPSRPFHDSANGSANYVTVGPGAAGVMAVSSITLTNLGNTQRSVFVFRPVLADGANCGTTNVTGGSNPRFYVEVPPNQTVHLTYPTPIIYPLLSGQSCLAFGGAAGVDVSVNGFLL